MHSEGICALRTYVDARIALHCMMLHAACVRVSFLSTLPKPCLSLLWGHGALRALIGSMTLVAVSVFGKVSAVAAVPLPEPLTLSCGESMATVLIVLILLVHTHPQSRHTHAAR